VFDRVLQTSGDFAFGHHALAASGFQIVSVTTSLVGACSAVYGGTIP
jgi:hypothetical protein